MASLPALVALLASGCGSSVDVGDASGDGGRRAGAQAGASAEAPARAGSTADISGAALVPDPDAITDVDDALSGVFIQPFQDCREPLDGRRGDGPSGQVCTNVAISGSTEAGRYFPDYGSCDVVRTQRPFWEAPPAAQPDPEDPRLQDDDYMRELVWAKEQIASNGCTCCHDSRAADGRVGQWDIAAEPIWITTLSDTGLALFAGFADSSVFGAYPPESNNGFSRRETGVPTDDPARMLAFLRAEMDHRGLTEAQALEVPPFGGPIYAASVAEPGTCGAGQGIDPDGTVHWTGGPARYLYVLEEGSENPGVPPNLDLPDGTLWRLDVRADSPALASGVAYGSAPKGTLQRVPLDAPPALEPGRRYQLAVLLDVGLPVTNCSFIFGAEPTETTAAPTADAGDPVSASKADCAPESGFGASCERDADCGCAEASYCARMPGQSTGNCIATGCLEDPSVCPQDWSCFDVSIFAPGQPSICLAP